MSDEEKEPIKDIELTPEDSIEPLETIEEEEETCTAVIKHQKDFDQVDSMLSQMINLNNDHTHHEPTCTICSSPLRGDAEDIWEKNRRTAGIRDLFEARANLKLSPEIIMNHMKHHKDGGIQEIKKVEYVDRIRRLYGKNVTTLDRLDLCLAVITERLMQINSISPSGDKSIVDIEKIKSAETVKLMGTYSNLLKLQATILGEMKDSGEIVSISRSKFIKVFNDAIIGCTTDNERVIVKTILDGLKGG